MVIKANRFALVLYTSIKKLHGRELGSGDEALVLHPEIAQYENTSFAAICQEARRASVSMSVHKLMPRQAESYEQSEGKVIAARMTEYIPMYNSTSS